MILEGGGEVKPLYEEVKMKKLSLLFIAIGMLGLANMAYSQSEVGDGESSEWTPSDDSTSSSGEDYAEEPTPSPDSDSDSSIEYESGDSMNSDE